MKECVLTSSLSRFYPGACTACYLVTCNPRSHKQTHLPYTSTAHTHHREAQGRAVPTKQPSLTKLSSPPLATPTKTDATPPAKQQPAQTDAAAAVSPPVRALKASPVCNSTTKAHKTIVRCLCFTADGYHLISGGEDDKVK